MGSLSITDRKISELRPYPRNARTHSRKQIKQIKASIEEFGFTNPVLIDETNQILAGHGRVKAAESLFSSRLGGSRPCIVGAMARRKTCRIVRFSVAERRDADDPPGGSHSHSAASA